MKNYKIKISGMTCSSCEETVSKSIRSLTDIIEVNVSLKSNTADIQAKKNIPIEDIQNVLPNKFTAHDYEIHETHIFEIEVDCQTVVASRAFRLGLLWKNGWKT